MEENPKHRKTGSYPPPSMGDCEIQTTEGLNNQNQPGKDYQIKPALAGLATFRKQLINRFSLFTILLLFFTLTTQMSVFAQSDCQSALQINADGSFTSINSSDYEFWFLFNDAQQTASFTMLLTPAQLATIDAIELYEDDCNNLVLLQTESSFEDTVLHFSSLAPNTPYYIRIVRNDNAAIDIDVALYSGLIDMECESSTICTKNYNGNFDESKMTTDLLDAIQLNNQGVPSPYVYTYPMAEENNPSDNHVCNWFMYYNSMYCNNSPQIAEENLGGGVFNYYLFLQAYNIVNPPYICTQKEHAKTPFEMMQGTKYILKFRYRTYSGYPVTGFELSVQNYPNAASTNVGVFNIPSSYTMGQWEDGEIVITAPFNANRVIFAPVLPTANNQAAIINLDDIEMECITTSPTGEYVLFHNATASDVISHYSTKDVSTTDYINITGNFSVDQDLSFITCQNLYFGANTHLTLTSGVRFEITENSHVRASCQCMWNTINAAYSTSTVEINGSTVEDGQIVVRTMESNNISLGVSTFTNNYQVLRIDRQAPTPQVFNGYVKGNIINGAASLPYFPYLGVRSHTAIRLSFVNDITIGGPNHDDGNFFNNWYVGVHSTNSLVNYFKNTFQDINITGSCYVTPPIDPLQINCPTAIFSTAIGPPIYFAHKITVGGSGLGNTFTNCYDGIYSVAQQVDFKYNSFNTIKNSIVCRDFLTNSFIKHNSFVNIESGVFGFLTSPLPRNFEVTNNTMTDVLYSGIHLNSINSEGRITLIVDDNSITFPSAQYASGRYGIRVENCNDVYVRNNLIQRGTSGVNPPPFDLAHYGISMSMSQGSLVRQNTINRMGRAIRMAGNCLSTQLCCNQMNYAWYGLFLDNPVMSPQGSSNASNGNTWTGYYGANEENRVYGTGAIFDWYYCSPCGTAHNPYEYQLLSPYANNHYVLCCGTYSPPNPPIDGTMRDAMFGGIVDGSALQGATLQSEYTAYSKEFLYETFSADTAWLNLDPLSDAKYQQYYQQLANENTGLFYEAKMGMTSGDTLTAAAYNNSVVDTLLVETNLKTVNDIYLQSYATGRFALDSLEADVLWSIALQNPQTGGKGVFMARNMLGIDPDDYNMSYRMAQTQANAQNSIFAIISPNPVSDWLYIEFLGEGDFTGAYIEVFDLAGRRLLSSKLPQSKISSVNLADLPQGYYLCRIMNTKQVFYSGKLLKK